MSRIVAAAEGVTSVPDASRGRRMTETFDPYQEAEEVDKKLNKLQEEHPITEDNINVWTLYHRTVQSSLILLEQRIERAVRDAAS